MSCPKIVMGLYPQLLEDLQLPREKDLTTDTVKITEYIIRINVHKLTSDRRLLSLSSTSEDFFFEQTCNRNKCTQIVSFSNELPRHDGLDLFLYWF